MLCIRPWHLGDRKAKDIAYYDTRRAQLSPDPGSYPDAVVQVFAARAWGVRGAFAEHTWVAVKPAAAAAYRVYQVKGWLFSEQGVSPVTAAVDIPDRYWMGSPPRLVFDLRGAAAERAIAGIAAAAACYPYKNFYRLWPGPNSNTFTAYLCRAVPELAVEMPVTAVGKDYPCDRTIFAAAPSGTGLQISLWGIAGVILAGREGLELNLLGLSVKFDFFDGGLELPGIGGLHMRL